MNSLDIKVKLKYMLVEMLKLKEDIVNQIKDDTDLIHDIGMNSIDSLEFLVLVEREFSIMIDDEDLSAELLQSLDVMSEYIIKKAS